MYASLKPLEYRSTELHFTLFFAVLLLHITLMQTATTGLVMMKYALLHPDEFQYPVSAFFLGFFTLISMFVAEFVNLNAI